MIKRTIRWLLFIFIVLYVVSGFGVTEFRTVEAITFGLLTKNLSFTIHNNIWIPFVILLGTHILFSPILALIQKRRENRHSSQ